MYTRSVTIEDALIRAVVDGDEASAHAFLAVVTPRIETLARAHAELKKRKLAQLEDDVAEVRMAALERIVRDDHKNLARYLAHREAHPERRPVDFESWLFGTVDFSVRDHLRRRYGRAPRHDHSGPKPAAPSRRDAGTLAGRLDEEALDRSLLRTLGATKRLTAAAILRYMREHFSAEECEAMRLFYYEDQGFAAIASRVGLPDAGAAEKLIRRLNARLRYHFSAE